jgi:HTH-type transcriptional regulator/antitoxin HigA
MVNMETKLIYKRIKSEEQYQDYVNRMEELDIILHDQFDTEIEDEIELIQLLIEDYESQFVKNKPLSSAELIQLLLNEHGKTASLFAKELGISKSVISEILSGKRSISKDLAIKISNRYKISLDEIIQ